MAEPQEQASRQDEYLDRLFEAGFINLYKPMLQVKDWTEEQQREFLMNMRSGIVRAYLQELSHNMLWDLLKLKFERADDQIKLAARYNRAAGALEVIDNLLNSGV